MLLSKVSRILAFVGLSKGVAEDAEFMRLVLVRDRTDRHKELEPLASLACSKLADELMRQGIGHSLTSHDLAEKGIHLARKPYGYALPCGMSPTTSLERYIGRMNPTFDMRYLLKV